MSTPLPPTPARRLGKTGIEVSPLGLAGNYGLAAGDLVRAFHELGLRYFLISPSLTDGIGQLVRDGHRDRIVLAGGAVVVGPGSVRRAWEAAAQSLRVEVIDVWHVYWVRTRLAVRASVWREMERLKREGRVRALAISCHDRRLARRLVDDLGLDAVMIRYNAAHRGAEQQLFDTLPPAPERPGIVGYTATRWGRLLRPAGGLAPMTGPECYRFALGHPQVDVVLSAPASYAELRDNVAGVAAGPLDVVRHAEVCRFGDAVRGELFGRLGFGGG